MIMKPSKRVLLVDDNGDVVEALSSGLVRWGSSVSSFWDPALALEAFEPGTFDVAVLDVRMEPIDGLELCRRLREVDPNLGICFLTAYADSVEDWPKDALLVQKPITLDGLSMALEDIESRNE